MHATSPPHRTLPILVFLLLVSTALAPAGNASPFAASCYDLVVNGGFEGLGGWMLGPTPIPPQYVTSPVFNGARTMRLGNLGQQANQASYSSVRQPIAIPASAASAQVSFWIWRQAEQPTGNDRMEALLLPPGTSSTSALSSAVKTVWTSQANAPTWQRITVPLNEMIGQTFELYFNAYNDGGGGRMGMVLDDVTLTYCESTTPTATPTSTGIPTGVPISWVGNLNPSGSNPQTRQPFESLHIAVEVYAAGTTNAPGQGAGIQCWLHWGSVVGFGQPWFNINDSPMVYEGDSGNNDRYGINLGPLPLGLYEYTAWCSGNGGLTQAWADTSASGGNGRLTVAGGSPTSTPTPTPTRTPTPTPTPTATGIPPAAVSWVGNLSPNGFTPVTLGPTDSLPVKVSVYAAGVTDRPGQGPGIGCGLYYGVVPDWNGPWQTAYYAAMRYIEDAGNDDRYTTTLGPLPPGKYEFTAWCSGNGGITRVWVDTGANGGNSKAQWTGPVPVPTVPTSTPVPPPPGPPPANCQGDLIRNGGFEYDGAWYLGPTQLMPTYAGPPGPVHSGSRSMRLGNALPSMPSVNSYSSARQTVHIPWNTQTARLSFWYYPSSDAAPGGQDRQELILLDPASGTTTAILWRVTENDQTWKSKTVDLTPYRGRSVVIYFNARNGGGGKRTAMFLDDVVLEACYGGPMPQPGHWPHQRPYHKGQGQAPQMTLPTGPAAESLESLAVPLDVLTPEPGVTQVAAQATATLSPGAVAIATATSSPAPPRSPTATATAPAEGSPATSIINQLGPWGIIILLCGLVALAFAVFVWLIRSR